MAIYVDYKELSDYNEFSQILYDSNEPIFIKKNGKVDLVAFSLDYYKEKYGYTDIDFFMLYGESNRHK